MPDAAGSALPQDFTPDDSGSERASLYRNRIVGHGEADPTQLLANPKNWRIHPQQQQDGLKAVLSEVGWVQSVIVNKRTGFVVDGHLRVALALRDEEPWVPVVYVDLSEAEEALVLATLDPLAALAGTDTDALAKLLREVETEDGDLRKLVEGIALQAGIAPIEFEPIATVDGEQAAKDEHVVRVVVHAHEQHEPALRALKALCDAHPEWSATVEV